MEPKGPDEMFWLDDQKDENSLIFEMWWSPFVVRVMMRPLNPDVANRVIDIAASIGAPPYDPQTAERFEGP